MNHKRNREVVRRPHRSDKYQYILAEVSTPNELLSTFSNQDDISHLLNPFIYNEELMELEEELRQMVRNMIENELTPLQKTILTMWMDGYTQCEIAEFLGNQQSSVHKSIWGNCDYKDNSGQKIYGGSINKLRKLTAKVPRIKEILDRINELREEKW